MTLRAVPVLIVPVLLVLLLLPGCAIYSLTPSEREVLEELEHLGLRPTEAGTLPPSTVGLANAWGPIGLLFGPDLGVVPLGGAGNFFLASRVEESSGQFWLGVLNSVTWPISTIWSVPQVVGDADVVNRKETAFHFTGTIRGVHELKHWRAQARQPAAGMPGGPVMPAHPPGDIADQTENE